MLGSVGDVERFSSLLYSGDKAATQVATEVGWDGFASAMSLQLMHQVLRESVAACSIFFVSHALERLVNSKFGPADLVTLEQILSRVIVERHKQLDAQSNDTIVRLLCSAVRKGFSDTPELRRFPLKVSEALMIQDENYSEDLVPLSCSILTVLIDTIGSVDDSTQNLAVNKKKSILFRDECLPIIFKSVSHCLKRLRVSHKQAVRSAVTLLRQVLLFDFSCSMEEITEDTFTLDYPQVWASDLVDRELFAKLWGLFLVSEEDTRLLVLILESLASLVSLRGSLYPCVEDQKARLSYCFEVTLPIMTKCLHLCDIAVLCEFCRLLNRLKPNFSIEQMCSVPCYERWIRALADFTHLCFQNWRHTRPVFLSLTSTWAKLVGSQSYSKEKCTLFEELAPKVCSSYIASNQEQAEAFSKSGDIASFGDYFLDEDAGTQELELDFASQLLRFCGKDAEEHISTLINSHLWDLKSPEPRVELSVASVYEQLSWLITLSSAWLSKYRSHRETCQTSCKVMWACFNAAGYDCRQKLSLSVPQVTRRHFHNSLIAMFRAAWNALLLDRLDDGSGLRNSFQSILSLRDRREVLSTVLEAVVDEVMNCVHSCADATAVEALSLLAEMSQSPNTVSILRVLPRIGDRLVLDTGAAINKNSRVYHRVLSLVARIKAQIFLSNGSFQGTLGDIGALLTGDFKICEGENVGRDRGFADVLMRTTCSWRGTFFTCVCQNQYKLLFKRVLPSINLVFRQFQRECGTDCGVQLLRLLDEITENRHCRIPSSAHNVDGYHVFRHVGGSIESVVNVLVGVLEVPRSHLEDWGVKCLRIVFHMGRNLLAGGYCNLGVLRLYSDPSLPACLEALWRAMLLVDRGRLCQCEKLARAYLALATELLRDVRYWSCCSLPVEHLLQVVYLLEFTLSFQNTFTSLITPGVEALAAFAEAVCCSGCDEDEEVTKVRASLLQADKTIFSRLLRGTLDLVAARKGSSEPFGALLQRLIVLDGDSFVKLGTLFSELTVGDGGDADLRETFALLQQCAFESFRRNNKKIFVDGFREFSTVIARCLS